MNKKFDIALFILIVSAIMVRCAKPYLPKPITSNSNILVIEGHISSNGDDSFITLSRTVPLSSKAGSTPETNATVTLEAETFTAPLFNRGDGTYYMQLTDLNPTKNYKLKIVTIDGNTYESDVIPNKDSPPIDSVYYRIKSDGLQIYTDAHDPTGKTRYYRWDYNETYIIHAKYYSSFVYNQQLNGVILRSPDAQIYQCWRSDSSSSIVLNSSEKLAADVVSQNPITFIASNSEKIGDRYSILVKQYAMTADEFNYYTQVKKITEQLGSIFDAQPSEISGNFHCTTNSKIPVIGFVGSGAVAQTRIFIDSRNLPAWSPGNLFPQCTLDTLYYDNPTTHTNDVIAEIYTGYQVPVNAIQPPGGAIIGFSASYQECVDCTLRGTNIQPDFWK